MNQVHNLPVTVTLIVDAPDQAVSYTNYQPVPYTFDTMHATHDTLAAVATLRERARIQHRTPNMWRFTILTTGEMIEVSDANLQCDGPCVGPYEDRCAACSAVLCAIDYSDQYEKCVCGETIDPDQEGAHSGRCWYCWVGIVDDYEYATRFDPDSPH